MERLTIPDVRVDEHTTRRTMIDARAVKEHAMEFYWRLKAYEDTGLTPEEIEKLRAQLPRWIPVEERLPEYGVRVLATDMYEGDDYTGIRTREEYPDDTDGCWYDERGRWYPIDDATHWMPLPKVPEVKKNG